MPFCGDCWSRAGVLRDATTMAWSGPQPQKKEQLNQRSTSHKSRRLVSSIDVS
jgi:hypothetical protein